MNPNSRSFFERVLLPASSKASISWQVIVPTSVISVLIQIFASGEIDYQNSAARAIGAALSVLPMFVLIWISHQIKISNVKLKVSVILLTHFFSGGVRGIVLSLYLTGIGFETGSPWDFRVQASVITMGMTVSILTYARSTYLGHGASVSALLQDTEKLRAALRKIEQESRVESRAQLAEVSERIMAELKSIELEPAAEQVAAIQKMIDEQVRPLSAQFAAELERFTPPPNLAKPVRLRDRLPSVESLTATPSIWFALAVSITPFYPSLSRFGFETAFRLSLFVFLALVPSLVVGMALARLIIPKLPKAFQILGLVLILEVIALPGVAGSYLALINTENPGVFVLGGLITFPIYGLIIAFSGALFRDLKVQGISLEKTNRELRWAISRANLLAWHNRGVTTRLLHGPVQNAMHAALLKLRTGDPTIVIQDVIDSLSQRIALAGLGGTARNGEPGLPVSFAELHELWEGVANVSVVIDEQAIKLLDADLPATAIAFDVASEMSSNAIRHGRASVVKIEIRHEQDILAVLVEDNGARPLLPRRKGIGSEFLESCSVSWGLTREDGVNRLVVHLPFAEPSSSETAAHTAK